MNRRNFVYNYIMKKSDFDNLQGDVEDGINDLANTLTGKGIVKGLGVTISGSIATVAAGIAFDGDGKQIKLTSSTEVDMSGVSRPGTGQFKWVTLILKHKVANEGTVTDGHNKVWPIRLLDSYETELLEGAVGTENGAAKPTVSASQVPLVDIKVDESTSWTSLTTESDRRPRGGLFHPHGTGSEGELACFHGQTGRLLKSTNKKVTTGTGMGNSSRVIPTEDRIEDFVKTYIDELLDMTTIWSGVHANNGIVNFSEGFNLYHFLFVRTSLNPQTNGHPNSRIGGTIIPTKTIILHNVVSTTPEKTIALAKEDIICMRFLTYTKAHFFENSDNALIGVYGLGRKK